MLGDPLALSLDPSPNEPIKYGARSNPVCRLRFKNVKESDRGRYSCLIVGHTENGLFSKWRNFTLITHKRSEAAGTGKHTKFTAPQSLSHRKDGAKPKFIDKLYMDNDVVMLLDDTRTLSCPFESKPITRFGRNTGGHKTVADIPTELIHNN